MVRSPLAVRPTFVDAPEEVAGTGLSGSAQFEVTPGITGDIDLRTYGLDAGDVLTGEGSVDDDDGQSVGGLLLILRDGLLDQMEIYALDVDPLPLPDLRRVTWWRSDGGG